jgi:hypothetical protein
MCWRRDWVAVAFILGLLAWIETGQCGAGQSGTIDSAWVTKAQTELKLKLHAYGTLENRLDEIREIQTVTGPSRAKGNLVIHPNPSRERFIRLGENLLLEQVYVPTDEKKPKTVRVQCKNSQYSFALTKARDDLGYVLTNYSPGKAKTPLDERARGVHGEVFAFMKDILDGLEKKPKYLLKAVMFHESRGVLLVHLRILAINADEQFKLDDNWNIIERRLETPYLVAIDQWSYGTLIDGVSFATGVRRSLKYKVAEGPPDQEITEKVVHIKSTEKDLEEFRMSAFGLDEPKGVIWPKPTRWWLWISLGAMASLGVGVAFRVFRRRSQRSGVVKP